MSVQELDALISAALECPCVKDLREGPCGKAFVAAFTVSNNQTLICWQCPTQLVAPLCSLSWFDAEGCTENSLQGVCPAAGVQNGIPQNGILM
jgi:hypothetical protein